MARRTTEHNEDRLELRYIPLSQAKLWDQNPKKHDIPGLMSSFRKHGFADPPKFDSALEAFSYGNGRTEALARMRDGGEPPPRGVYQAEDGGWAIPVLFGVDAKSRAAAAAFAIDHNNLSATGSDLDVLKLWEPEPFAEVLRGLPDPESLLVSLGGPTLEEALKGLADAAKEREAPGDPGFTYKEQFGVIVQCESEQHQKEVYEKLLGEGFNCRVVTV